MIRPARIAILLVTVFLIITGYCLLNLRYFSRNLGYDEVYYSAWVDHWDDFPVYYPHHLIFAPSSVWFQNHFTEFTGITNTTFIQKFKNTLFVSAGLGAFFLLFYARSKRYWLSLTIVVLIAFSGSLWHDATAHETAAIPAILINLAVLVLLFYRKVPYPLPVIVIVALLQSVAILLHQAYFLSIPSFFAIFLLSVHGRDHGFRILRNMGRSAVYLLLVVLVTGGTYYYIGFVRMGLRMQDNPEGAQTVPFFESIPIQGNFVRFFYLVRAWERWGGIAEDPLRQAVNGYGSSFITSFRTDRIDTERFLPEDPPVSNIVLIVLGSVLVSFFVFLVPAYRRYGPTLPALLVWMALGSIFVYWWEPWYIEHWLYLTVLTWVLLFIVLDSVLSRVKHRLPRGALSVAMCVVLLSFGALMYSQNLANTIRPRMARGAPVSVSSFVWDEAYFMDELYRDDQEERP